MDKETHERLPVTVWWRDPRFWLRAVVTYAVATLAGYLAKRIGIPLPWMLGPFFVCGALAAAGAPLAIVPMGREFAQLFVGLAVGLRFTPATLVATVTLLPAMLGATLFVMAYTLVAALLLKPLSRVDDITAFFATAAGGVADMALIARDRGGDPGPVAIVHALRVSATVALIPIIVVTFGEHGTKVAAAAVSHDSMLWVAVAIVVSFGAVQLFKRTPLPNPWLVVPMFIGIALGASGAMNVTVPWVFIVVAQIALGTWLGSRFRREIITTIPRVAGSGLVISVFMIACAGGGAFVLSRLTDMPVSTAFLALAPAAVTEMVITAKTMGLDAELITAFHVMRIAIVCSTILGVFRLYNRIRGGQHGPRV